ncbi:MAG: RraA family protein [Minwuiales bacterium]|nr:RraA family protein [Minwuiales bacterium]
MIGDPVAIVIRRSIERPSKSLVNAFAGAQTSFVVDAMNGKGALDYRIKPIKPGCPFVGTAVTASGGPRDNLGAMAMLDFVEAGDVLVIATGADESGAVIGDNYARVAKKLGVVAIVTDGLVRDAAGINDCGMPAYARGTSPNAGYPHGPGEVNQPVALGPVAIQPGDILVGDDDGIVVVPLAEADTIAAQLEKVKSMEAKIEASITSGERRHLWNPTDYEDRGGVKYLD